MQERRRARRRTVQLFGAVWTPSHPIRPCLIVDVSDTGARLSVKDAGSLPENFTLFLSRNGDARRDRVETREKVVQPAEVVTLDDASSQNDK